MPVIGAVRPYAMAEEGREFSELFERHESALFRYVMTFVSRPGDAEEVVQRTAVVLWEKFAEYDRERAFLPWARGVAYFELLSFRREKARGRLVFREDILAALAATREEQDEFLDAQRDALLECLGKVDAEGVALLRRRYCNSETTASLAEELGKTSKSLYRRLDRLRELLAACVERRLKADEM